MNSVDIPHSETRSLTFVCYLLSGDRDVRPEGNLNLPPVAEGCSLHRNLVSPVCPVAVRSLEGQAFGQLGRRQLVAAAANGWERPSLTPAPSFQPLDH